MRDQLLIWRLGRAIAVSLKGDRSWRTEEAGKKVDKILGSEPPLHWEAWHRMKWWYWAAVDRAPPPAQVTLMRITAEQVDLYRYVPPPGENIPVSVELFPVDDSVPTKDKIEWAVTRLQNHRSGGTSGMRDEYLKRWLTKARNKERDEVATDQENMKDGETAGPNSMGREGTEEIRKTTPAEDSNWERVVDLFQTAFG